MADTRLLARLEKERAEIDENKDPCKGSLIRLLQFRARGYVLPDTKSFEALNTTIDNEMKAAVSNTSPKFRMPAACNVLNRHFLPYAHGIAGLFTLAAEAGLGKPEIMETAELSKKRLGEVTTRMEKCYASFYRHDSMVAAKVEEAQTIQRDISDFQRLYSQCLTRQKGR
jgi:hypothetical protein